MLSKVELAKTRDFSETINDTFLFIRQNLKPLIKYFFTFCGIFLVAGLVSGVLTQLKITNALSAIQSAATNGEFKPSAWGFFGVEWFLTLFFAVFTFVTINVTTLSYMALYKEKGNQIPTTQEMWDYIKYFYLRVLGSSVGLSILAFIGLALCIAPGVYLYTAFALVIPIIIFENTSFSYAFNRCFVLIKDNWWATFGCIIIIWIITYVATLIISLPASIITIVSTIITPQKSSTIALPAAIVTVLLRQIALVFIIVPIVTISLCYFNLTESKDGTSLLDRINKLGSIKPDTDTKDEDY